jgi:hypothetical protein
VEGVKERKPAYSLQGRTYVPAGDFLIPRAHSSDNTKKPGPGTHSPEKVAVHKKHAPAFSMGVRHSDYTTPLIVDVPD